MKKVDFGLVLHTRDMSASELMKYNRLCIQALPSAFSTLWIEDHFQFPESEALECLTTLSFLASEFPRFSMGTLVLCQSYRNPALLAKMASNLHFLSNGRLILGIGAGWNECEYRAYGYPFPPYKTRVKQLEETICVIKSMWTGQPDHFAGQYYQVNNASCNPRPYASIPLLIGGGGEKEMLNLVAHHANWWNVNDCKIDDYERKVTLLKEFCRKIERDPSEIRLTYSTGKITITEQVDKSKLRVKANSIVGNPTEVLQALDAYRALGVTHFMVKFPDLSTLERFVAEVLPYFA